MTEEEFLKAYMPEPILDGEELPSFCKSHHCSERSAACAKCGYTAMGSSDRRKLEA